MLNAAIVGLGWWGRELVRSVQGSSPRIGFSRADTLEPDLARAFAAEQGLTLGTSYEEVLADLKIEAVVLATPHTLHRPQVEAAARAGKHVFLREAVRPVEGGRRGGARRLPPRRGGSRHRP